MKNYNWQPYNNEEILALRKADLAYYENRLRNPQINEETKLRCEESIKEVKEQINSLLILLWESFDNK